MLSSQLPSFYCEHPGNAKLASASNLQAARPNGVNNSVHGEPQQPCSHCLPQTGVSVRSFQRETSARWRPIFLRTFMEAARKRNYQLAVQIPNTEPTSACRCPTMHWSRGGHPRHPTYHISLLLTVFLIIGEMVYYTFKSLTSSY